MKLLFDQITKKTRRYSLNHNSWFHQEVENLSISANADITVSRRDRETVIVAGEMLGHRTATCDRCGEQVKHELKCEFDYLVTTKEEATLQRDVECSEEDAATLYLTDPEIDIAEILREQTYLAIPPRTLCREDCKGICAGCGVVLNHESCCCSSDNSDSPFAVLGKLSKK